MSIGMIAGQVLGRTGAPAPGATIALTRAVSAEGNDLGAMGPKGEKKFIYGTVRKNGRFQIPFVWSGTEIAGALLGPTLYITAFTEQGGWTNAKATVPARGYLIKDVLTLSQSFMSTFGSVPEIADFGVDIVNTIKGYSPTPLWKTTSLWTTESWVIAAGAYVHLR
jgi:hypothetical protein